jgi:DNA-binding PadR family transcriptional regulator
MEDRLKSLKRAMKNHIFGEFHFTEDQKKDIRQQMNQPTGISEEEILLAIMQLLNQERTGFELSKLIRARGIKRFEQDEGFLYMRLHQLEHKGYLTTYWDPTEVKYYQLNMKGKRLLKKLESQDAEKGYLLKEILEVRAL